MMTPFNATVLLKVGYGIQSKIPDQFLEGIAPDRFVVVTLGDTGLVSRRGGAKSPRLNLASHTAAGFEERHSAFAVRLLLEQPRRHQTTRPTANDRNLHR